MKKRILAYLMASALLLSVCSAGSAESTGASTLFNVDECFSDRDFDADYSDEKTAFIQLSGDTASCESNAVSISGGTVTITDEGAYILSGTLNDGAIVVSADSTDKVRLVLNGVSVSSASSAALYVAQADKVFVTLASGTVNALANGGAFDAAGGDNIDAAVFSKDDITFNGSGSLTISSPAGHGIVSKDDLSITGGVYQISAASQGISGKDAVCIAQASLTIASGKDGIHAENADDVSKGYIYISSGTFDLSAQGDGMSAAAGFQIDGGDFHIVTGGGSANAARQTSDTWGAYPGGGRGGFGGRGGRSPVAQDEGSTAQTDAASIKGIKAAGSLLIRGGSFTIDSADDAVHGNASITISGGTFDIAAGDDGFHADETLLITGGTINISESYEGLEALNIEVSGGDIALVATDDGLNAAGGSDQSGFGGFRGNDRFGGAGGASNASILISGGTLNVTASGDGIDANGSLTISGGYTVVCGPTQGDTSTLDYDQSGVITGGTFIGTGAYSMAQSFSDSSQGVIAISVGNQSAGTAVSLKSVSGEPLLTHTPGLPYAVVILSSPELVKGTQYTISLGGVSNQVTAN